MLIVNKKNVMEEIVFSFKTFAFLQEMLNFLMEIPHKV